jgi:hypothetical protein
MEPTWRIRGFVFNKLLRKNPFGPLVYLLVLLWVTVVTVDLVEGKDNDGDAINWAYQEALDDGFYFGTQENAQVYDLPLSYTFRSLENEDWGLELKFPITIGIYNIESEKEDIDINLLAVVPGIEFQFPVRNNWILMPVGHLGLGRDTSGGDLIYIYSVGIRSHVLFGWDKLDFTFGNALRNKGYFTGGGGPDDNFSTFDTGLDMRFPMGFRMFGKDGYFSIYGINYYFFDKTIVIDSEKNSIEVNCQWEIGITLSTIPSWKIWFFEIERLGVGYRFGNSFNAVRLVFGMPF